MIKKWSSLKDYKITYAEIADVLELSVRSAINFIASMQEKGLINVSSGSYYVNEKNQIRQKPNSYTVNDEVEEDVIFKSENIKQNKTSKKNSDNFHNWFDYSAKLTVKDMELYLTTDDIYLKEKAEERIERIKKSKKGKQLIARLMNEANKKIIVKEKEKELREISGIDPYDESQIPWAMQEYKYQKKRKSKDDISFLID